MENIIDINFGSINVYDFLNALIAVIFAALMSFVTTPIVRVIAFRIRAVDDPNRDNRRMHTVITPKLGGLAIFFSFVLSVFIFYEVSRFTLSMVAGAFLLIIIGILDDVFTIRALYRFLVHIGAAVIVVSQGTVISYINVFGHYIKFGILAAPLTVLWIVGVTIAVNLIDGLDGLSCGISTISAVSLMIVTILLGEFQIALLIAIIAAACIGFMPFNREPAKIFVGETGATFLGFSLAVVSIQGLFKTQAVITYIIPFLILGVPIFDTAFAMLRRILSGRHPFSADKGHLHHRLVDMGFNKKQSVQILYAVSALLGVSSIMLITQKIVYAVIIIAVSLAISVAMWIIFKDEKMKIESGLISENGDDQKKEEKSDVLLLSEKNEITGENEVNSNMDKIEENKKNEKIRKIQS